MRNATQTESKTIKFESLEKISTALEIPIRAIFDNDETVFKNPEQEDELITLREKVEQLEVMTGFYKREVKDKDKLLRNCESTSKFRKETFNLLLDFVLEREGIDKSELKNKIQEGMDLISDPSKHILLHLSTLNYMINKSYFK